MRDARPEVDDRPRRVARQALEALQEAFQALAGAPLPTDGHRVSYLMALASMHSLWGAMELLEQDYYPQAATVVRSALEYWAASVYLWKRPEQGHLWLQPDYRRQPGLEEMRKALPKPYSQRWRRTYDRLSELAHPRLRGLLSVLEQARHDPLQPHHDHEQWASLHREVAKAALAMLETFPPLAEALSRRPPLAERKERARQALKALGD